MIESNLLGRDFHRVCSSHRVQESDPYFFQLSPTKLHLVLFQLSQLQNRCYFFTDFSFFMRAKASARRGTARDAARRGAARSRSRTKIWHHSAVVCPSDLITCQQTLHLEESREFTREQHAKGDASARDDNLRSGFFFYFFASLLLWLEREKK